MSNHALYICYFGLREPLVQTQVLPYIREIKKIDNLKMSLLTFEPEFKKKWTTEKIEAEKQKLAAENINWYCLPYHKRPSAPATIYDTFCGAWFVWKMIRREKVDILHARVLVPALIGAIARKFSRQKPKLLFDIRGFFAEEYTDAGIWKENGWLYRAVKQVEKWILKESDGFVVLTEKAREILFPESLDTGRDKFGRPVAVIPCCVDLDRFSSANETSRKEIRRKYNLENRRVIIYVGSFGGWYLTDEILDFYQTAKEQDPQTFALILTQRDKEKVIENLRERGFSDADFLVETVSPSEIPKFLSAADVAFSFIKACYSKLSSSPTKIAEYLAGGVPIIANDGVGDVTQIITGEKVGAIVKTFDKKTYLQALGKVEELKETGDLSEKCRTSAREKFDLEEVGGTKYRSLYKRLLAE